MKYFKIIFGLICLTVAFSTASAEDKTTNLSNVENSEFVIRKCIVQATENSCLEIPGLTSVLAKELKPEHLTEAMKTHNPVEIAQASRVNSFFPPDNKTITKWTVSFDNKFFSIKESTQIESDWANIIASIMLVTMTIIFTATGKISFNLNDRFITLGILISMVSYILIYYYINGLIVGFPNWFVAALPGILYVMITGWIVYGSLTSVFTMTCFSGILCWHISTIPNIGEFVNTMGIQSTLRNVESDAPYLLGISILLITLDYTIIIYRKYQESKSKAALFN